MPIALLIIALLAFAAIWSAARLRATKTRCARDMAALRETQAKEINRHSQDQFRRIFQSAPAAYAIISLVNQRMLEINPAMCKHYAVTEEAAIGKSMAELGIGIRDEPTRAMVYEALRLHGHIHNFEVPMVAADGCVRSTLLSAEKIEYLGEQCMLALSIDVTEVREAQRALGAQAAAEAANRAKTEFLSRMSHELRTPLNAVIGFSRLLQNEAHERLAPLDRERINYIHRAGRHLLGLVNDVLDVSGIEAGRIDVRCTATRLLPLLDDVLRTSETLARQSGVALVAEYAQGPDPARIGALADATRLRQVVINLMSNAIKYNRPGGSVTLRMGRDGDRISIDVIDNGMGMTAEQLDHLYEPFNRLGRERGGIEGTGIGLALTRQLVRLMNGELCLHSEIGRGTRANVLLNAAEVGEAADLDEACSPRRWPCGDLGAIANPGGTVLYIEDNEVNALLVQQMLALLPGVRLVHVADGKAGLEQALALQPDLILLDMQLPDMNGIDVLRTLRGADATRHLRVIALSASAMAGEVEQARRCGADDYWTKPLDFEGFLAGITEVLSCRRVAA
jgi:PAS domain S-box-containing protein